MANLCTILYFLNLVLPFLLCFLYFFCIFKNIFWWKMIVIRPLKCISWWWRTCVLSFTSVSNFPAFGRHQAKLLLEKIFDSSDTKSHLIRNLIWYEILSDTGFILFAGKQGPAPPCSNLTGVETPEKEEKGWKSVEEKERLQQQGHQDDSKVNSEISVS